MPEASPEVSAKRSRAARAAHAVRWGERGHINRRIVRLDDLTPDQRRLVLALIEAAKTVNRGRENTTEARR